MSAAKGGLPTYLSRLAGGAPAAAPRLQPPRPLFPPDAGALTGLEPEAPRAGFVDPAGPVHPGASHTVGLPSSQVDGQPGQSTDQPVPISSSVANRPAGPLGDQTSRGRSDTQAPGGAAPDRQPAAPALPARTPTPAAPPGAFAPTAQGPSPGGAGGATTHTAPQSAAPASATPATTVPSTAAPTAARNGDSAPHPAAASPPAPPSVTAASAARRLVPPAPEATSPGLVPVGAAAAQPAGSTLPGMGPAPAMPSPPAAPEPAAPAGALLPPKRVPSALDMSNDPAVRRPGPVNAPAGPQVSIGTIEVTVVAPTPSSPPAPAQHPQAGPGWTGAAGRASAEAAWHAARGAARRWFGAGQS